MSNTYAVYYLMYHPLNLMGSVGKVEPDRRYVHPSPDVRRLQDAPAWTDRATAERLAKEYGGTIVYKCPTTGEPLDKEPPHAP